MKINNFYNISKLLDFSDPEKFYLLEIIQRKKDIPELDKSTRLIKSYGIQSLEQLEKLKPEIIGLCEYFGARAGLYINRRSNKNTARAMMKTLADDFVSGNFNGISHLYTSSAAAHGFGDKRWILDIDLTCNEGTSVTPCEDFDIETLRTVERDLHSVLYRNLLDYQPTSKDKLVGMVPTVHGWHAVVDPFDTREFEDLSKEVEELFNHYDLYASVELKKDNMLNLYIP